jgi:hypothetical protein
MRPGDPAGSGPLRLLPVELTNFNNLPLMTEGQLRLRGFGAKDGHPGFQLLYLDKNSWQREADGLSFWTKGHSRAELLVRTNEPERRLEITLRAGPKATNVAIDLEGHRADVSLAPGQAAVVQLAPPPGFKYGYFQGQESYIWRLSITTDSGFVPNDLRPEANDSRLLGVLVTPLIIR